MNNKDMPAIKVITATISVIIDKMNKNLFTMLSSRFIYIHNK